MNRWDQAHGSPCGGPSTLALLASRGALLGGLLVFLGAVVIAPLAVARSSERVAESSERTVVRPWAVKSAARCNPGETAVQFTGDGGTPLAGTFTTPCHVHAPVAGVLLLAGSGPTDRNGDEAAFGLTPHTLRDLAFALASRGVASLRYDKRGVEASRAGVPSQPSAWPGFFAWLRFRGDATRGLRVLAARPEVDRRRLAVLGHSEGGLLALEAAVHTTGGPQPRALALLATPGRPIQTVEDEQLAHGLSRSGATKAEIRRALRRADRIWAAIRRRGSVPADVPEELQPLFPSYLGPFLQQEARARPGRLARRFPGPVLLVNGTRDHQVSATRDAPALARALAARHPDDHTLWLVRGVGHGLDRASADPGRPIGPVLPDVASRIADWLAGRLR